MNGPRSDRKRSSASDSPTDPSRRGSAKRAAARPRDVQAAPQAPVSPKSSASNEAPAPADVPGPNTQRPSVTLAGGEAPSTAPAPSTAQQPSPVPALALAAPEAESGAASAQESATGADPFLELNEAPPPAAAPEARVPDVWRIGPARPAPSAPQRLAISPEHERATESLLEPGAQWSNGQLLCLQSPPALQPGQLAQLDLPESEVSRTPLLRACAWSEPTLRSAQRAGWTAALLGACDLVLRGATQIDASEETGVWWQVRRLEARLTIDSAIDNAIDKAIDKASAPFPLRLAPPQAHGLSVALEADAPQSGATVKTLELSAGPGVWLWLAQPGRLGSEQARRLGATIRTGGVKGQVRAHTSRPLSDMSAMTGHATWSSQAGAGMMELSEHEGRFTLQVLDRQGRAWRAEFTRAAAMAVMAWPQRPEAPAPGSAQARQLAGELLRPGSWHWAATPQGHVLEERNWRGHYRIPQRTLNPESGGGRPGQMPLSETPLGEVDPGRRGAAQPSEAWRPVVVEACMLALQDTPSTAQGREDRALAGRVLIALAQADGTHVAPELASSAPVPGAVSPGAAGKAPSPGPRPGADASPAPTLGLPRRPTSSARAEAVLNELPERARLRQLEEAVSHARAQIGRLESRRRHSPSVQARDLVVESLVELLPELEEAETLLSRLRKSQDRWR